VNRQSIRATAALSLLAFAVVACGQKPGAHVIDVAGQQPNAGQPQEDPGTASTDTTGGVDLDDSTTTDDDGGSDGTTGTSGTTGTTGTSGTTGTTGTSGTTGTTGTSGTTGTTGTDTTDGSGDGGSTTDGSTQQRQVRGSDRTGAGPDKIVLAGHAPVTGAAPLPTTSFEQALDLYWLYVKDQGQQVLGRDTVEVIFRDDKYDPNSARQVCRELEAKAFTVAGGGGTDQIQACGQFAGVAQFPYTSAGVTEAGLRDNPWYYATSMSYRQQGVLLAQMVNSYFPGARSAMVVTDTPNFDDAVDGWLSGVQQQGLDYYETLKHPKGDTSWYNSFASKLAEQEVDVVYILSSPVDYIRFAQQADQQGYNPQYVGVGISMGLNAVLGSGCGQVHGGMFFSPFPGLDWAHQNVPEFFETAERHGKPQDDIALALWANNKVAHALFLRYQQVYGNDLTREDFRDLVETQTNVETGVFPTLNYSPDDHFGAGQVHLLRANCDAAPAQYETVEVFKTAF